MRLRLRIERNELPPVQVLHAIPPTQQSQTISQFLQSINALFPLESTTWDISDYTVLVAGYEATHYTEVGQAFKDEDEVVIKPLGFAELRARTLSGRDQISEDGRHLLDGVPFGRPMLKRPRRPEVNIPARKRQKADEVVDAQALLRLDADDEEDDEEDDEDFEEAEVEEDSEDDDENGAGDSGDSSDSDSSAKGSSSDGSASSSDDSSDSDSSSSSSESESEASWDGLEGKVSTVKAAPKPNGTAAPQPEQQQNLPHQGKSRTKERNDRKRDSRRLKHLKEAGLLPQNATLQDMQNWQKEKDLDDESVTLAGQKAKMESGRQRLLEQIASGGVDIASPVPASREDDEPPEEQSSRPVATAKDIMDEATSSDAASTQIITEAQQAADTTPVKAKTKREADTDADQSPASKRARLDTRSMNRLVFGSLGLRTPKTQEERDALQKKLSTRPTRAGAATAPAEAMTEPTPQADEAPDSWREKVVLTAVECVDENVTLSEPPFPFQQRWDPQYQFSAKQRKRSRARKPNAQTNGEFIETYDKYNQNGGGDALDYDDPKDDQEGDDSYWEEGALLDNGDEAEGSDDEFPPLPADHASLPSLVEADAKVGDFITYQELAVSAATGWEPKVVAQIAKLEAKTDDGFWTLMLRQSRPKEYDENGNRIYTKFEMEDFSEDGTETDSKTLSWVELQNPKLLLRSVDTKAS
ncbi:hypothetical protein CB0940_07660 [Cercospora beticola]|uniref:DUF7357 domain-containing protein n=1 Tax=Cercospora beticola TaxID=122368 RepID=A0A2G5H920_CERBT|nr:hypothetical protein CB0940_07660 [Cercospora beticola]PIA89030.1 hypothetical protein CB0940_07660 [Cercospora beticola]WPB03626.1 hypothetical protein RHO25_008266 [Cercospora beticola]